MIRAFRSQPLALLAWLSTFVPLHAFAQADAPAANAPAEQPLAPIVQSQAGAIPASMLPHDLTPWQMFMDADIVVKVVMIGLAFASLVTWTVWLAKSVELRYEKRRAREKDRWLENARSLIDAQHEFSKEKDPVARLVRACRARDGSLQRPSKRRRERTYRLAARAGGSDREPADRQRHGHSRHHRRDRSRCRVVRHRLGHHEQLHRYLESAHHESSQS